jgi:hypothetical protein
MTQNPITDNKILERISLGVEEYSLSLGAAGRPDLGRAFLLAVHPEADDDYIQSVLTSASHSLNARDLIQINREGKTVLQDKFASSIRPLIEYDWFMYLTFVKTGRILFKSIIYASQKHGFSTTLNKSNAVQTIEHGEYTKLSKYLFDLVEEAVVLEKPVEKGISMQIRYNDLNSVLETRQASAEINSKLQNSGWNSEDANALIEDLNRQLFRGSLFRIIASDKNSSEDWITAQKSCLLFLKGEERSWLFDFPTIDRDPIGTASLIDKKTLMTALNLITK